MARNALPFSVVLHLVGMVPVVALMLLSPVACAQNISGGEHFRAPLPSLFAKAFDRFILAGTCFQLILE